MIIEEPAFQFSKFLLAPIQLFTIRSLSPVNGMAFFGRRREKIRTYAARRQEERSGGWFGEVSFSTRLVPLQEGDEET
jgi:hypothetical protein